MMNQSYLFQEDNLAFRPLTESDIDFLFELDADPETMSFFPGGARTPEQIKNNATQYINAYHKNGYGMFIVFDTTTDEFIGRAGFADVESGEIEVGYLVIKNHWGKGYASRILKILLDWARNNIKKNKIIAFTPIQHAASERVMQKAGMVFSKKGIMKGVECAVYEYEF